MNAMQQIRLSISSTIAFSTELDGVGMKATRTFLIVLAIAAWMQCSSSIGAEKKTLIIGVDGLRPDQMQIATTPNIDALIANGSASLTAENVGVNWGSSSGQNWASVLTGVNPDIHSVAGNHDTDNNINDDTFGTGANDVRSIFGLAKQHDAGITTGVFTTWTGIVSPVLADSLSVVDYLDTIDNATDIDTRNEAVDGLLSQGAFAGADLDLMFVHLDQVDREGHGHTYDSPEYRGAIEFVDGLIGDLVTAVNSRPTIANEDWLIMLTADHGGLSDQTTHGPNSELLTRTVPYIVSGSSALQGAALGMPSIFDVTPTALAHLGVDVESLSLTGSPVGLADEPGPIPLGDLDGDFDIDSDDWLMYVAGLGVDMTGLDSAIRYSMGDLNDDGFNNFTDFVTFKNAFEQAHGPSSFADMLATSSEVPEPSSCLLSFFGLLALSLRYRRI